MPDQPDTRPQTREDLQRIIAAALRRSRTFLAEADALAAADTVLRDLKAAGVIILRDTKKKGNYIL